MWICIPMNAKDYPKVLEPGGTQICEVTYPNTPILGEYRVEWNVISSSIQFLIEYMPDDRIVKVHADENSYPGVAECRLEANVYADNVFVKSTTFVIEVYYEIQDFGGGDDDGNDDDDIVFPPIKDPILPPPTPD